MKYRYNMSFCFWRRTNREDAAGNAPVSLRLTLNGRAEIATKISIPAAYWRGDVGLIQLPAEKKHREPHLDADRVKFLNSELRRLRSDAEDMWREFRHRGRPFTAKQVAAALRDGEHIDKPVSLLDLMEQFEQAMRRPAMHKAPATLSSYVTRLDNLREFLKKGIKLPHLLACEVTMQTGRQLERWSQDRGFGEQYVRKQVNMLQMVLSFAAKEGLVALNVLHGYRYDAQVVVQVPVFLPEAELQILKDARFTDVYLREIADMWLFMCYTGLSYVDYIRYATEPATFTHRDHNGQDWIRMVRQKMMRRKPEGFSVPLLADATALLVRRQWLLPRLDNAYVNRKLKEIGRALDIKTTLTCKLARATFSQHMRDNGISGEAVASMMGDSEVVMNRHYSRIREERIARELGVMFINRPSPPEDLPGTGTDGQ